MNKGVIAHAILAAGGLVLAYTVWTDDGEEMAEGEVAIFECRPERLVKAELASDSEHKTTVMEPEQAAGETTVWFTVEQQPEEGEATREHFVGTEQAVEFLEKLAPLVATRSLGALDEAQLEEIELKEPKTRLTLKCGEREATFDVGGSSYGSGDRYVRRQGEGPVYLVASDRLQPLDQAPFRLMQRQVHTFESTEVASIKVEAHGESISLTQRNRLEPQRAEWVDTANPDRRNELYGNWLTLFTRLRVQKYLEGEPGSDLDGESAQPETVVKLQYLDERDREIGRLELAVVRTATPAYYVRSETTRNWVRITDSVASQIEEDSRQVVGLEAQPDASGAGAAGTAPSRAASPAGGSTGAAVIGAQGGPAIAAQPTETSAPAKQPPRKQAPAKQPPAKQPAERVPAEPPSKAGE